MLDTDLLAFIRASIRSTWALELLLLLRRQTPGTLSVDELVLALRATPALIHTCLDQLQRSGMVASTEAGGWRFEPASPVLDKIAADLEATYAERPVAVISAILASPNERLRNFADAFRFPKKDD